MYIGGLNAQGACSLSQHFSPWPKPPGGKLPGLLRKLLNRLRTKVERFKDNLTRWGFIDRSANINPTVACLYRQWAFVKKTPRAQNHAHFATYTKQGQTPLASQSTGPKSHMCYHQKFRIVCRINFHQWTAPCKHP